MHGLEAHATFGGSVSPAFEEHRKKREGKQRGFGDGGGGEGHCSGLIQKSAIEIEKVVEVDFAAVVDVAELIAGFAGEVAVAESGVVVQLDNAVEVEIAHPGVHDEDGVFGEGFVAEGGIDRIAGGIAVEEESGAAEMQSVIGGN